jgi:hypothetical protein
VLDTTLEGFADGNVRTGSDSLQAECELRFRFDNALNVSILFQIQVCISTIFQ